jgi:hypothetical protein
VPASFPKGRSAPCGQDGGSICDGAGHCVACVPGDTRACYSGPAGTLGVGACQAGVQYCRGDGSGFDECIGEVLPSAEQCNGLDDDCDGNVDNLPEITCELGLPNGFPGNCDRGRVRCLGGEPRCCSVACSLPGEPLCV